MKIPALFKEYIWLVNTIRRAGKISLKEINNKWLETEMSEGIPFARTTFNRHKDAIEDIFGIYIDCDRRDGYRYFIGNEEVLKENSVQNWMLTTISVSNIVSESLSLQQRILLESIPSESVWLTTVIKAMKQNNMLDITYQRYEATVGKNFKIAPYCIKLFRRRWYLLSQFEDGDFAMLSFDRIKNIKILSDKFKMDGDFNATEFFSECFGVFIGEGIKAERIILRAYGRERYYLNDLPLHPSQKEIAVTDEYSDYEYWLRPTNDFKSYVMSRGEWLQVLEPKKLADEVKQWLSNALKLYI